MINEDRKDWYTRAQEQTVEGFYREGADSLDEPQGGFLNLGYWDRKGMTYIEAAENMVRRMGDKLGLDEASALLDVGCGMGAQDVYLHRRVNPRTIDALDVTWSHVEKSRARAKRSGIPEDRLRFHHGTAVHLPFGDREFTHLLSIEAAEHFDTRDAFFHEAARVLRPGGVMALCDFLMAREPEGPIDDLTAWAATRLCHVPRANIYGEQVYGRKLAAAGFTDVTFERVGAATISGYFDHRISRHRKGLDRVRGLAKSAAEGLLIDFVFYQAFKVGLMDCIFIRAVRA